LKNLPIKNWKHLRLRLQIWCGLLWKILRWKDPCQTSCCSLGIIQHLISLLFKHWAMFSKSKTYKLFSMPNICIFLRMTILRGAGNWKTWFKRLLVSMQELCQNLISAYYFLVTYNFTLLQFSYYLNFKLVSLYLFLSHPNWSCILLCF